jgi:hypothetical protein
MPKITIAEWRRKPDRPRYFVSDGREPVGVVFEKCEIFTAVTSSGYLIGAFGSLTEAARSLPRAASS